MWSFWGFLGANDWPVCRRVGYCVLGECVSIWLMVGLIGCIGWALLGIGKPLLGVVNLLLEIGDIL